MKEKLIFEILHQSAVWGSEDSSVNKVIVLPEDMNLIFTTHIKRKTQA